MSTTVREHPDIQRLERLLDRIHYHAANLEELTRPTYVDKKGQLQITEKRKRWLDNIRWAFTEAHIAGSAGLDASRPAEGTHSDPTGDIAAGRQEGDAPDPRVERREHLHEARRRLKDAVDEVRECLGLVLSAAMTNPKDRPQDLPWDKGEAIVGEDVHQASLEARAGRLKRGDGWGRA